MSLRSWVPFTSLEKQPRRIKMIKVKMYTHTCKQSVGLKTKIINLISLPIFFLLTILSSVFRNPPQCYISLLFIAVCVQGHCSSKLANQTFFHTSTTSLHNTFYFLLFPIMSTLLMRDLTCILCSLLFFINVVNVPFPWPNSIFLFFGLILCFFSSALHKLKSLRIE